MKRKSKILIGSAIVFVALLIALFLARKQFVGGPGSPTEGSRAVKDGGIKIPGWNGRVDPAEEKAGMTLDVARLATFNEPKYMNLNSHPHPYGVFTGGNDMGTPSQRELYCAAFGNGKFILRGFGPEPLRMNGFLGESNAVIHKAAGRGQRVTQDISLSVKGDKVVCSINGSIVASYSENDLVGSGKLKSTNGYDGLRFAHNTDVFVNGLVMSTN